MTCLTIIPSGNITSSKLIEDVGRPQCVPLPHCKSIYWIWRHRSKLPGIDEAEVEKYVFSLNCGAQVENIQCSFVSLFHINKFYLTQRCQLLLMLHYPLVMSKGNKNQPI